MSGSRSYFSPGNQAYLQAIAPEFVHIPLTNSTGVNCRGARAELYWWARFWAGPWHWMPGACSIVHRSYRKTSTYPHAYTRLFSYRHNTLFMVS